MSFDLNTAWFLLVGILLAGYAVLDGFDLGVGALHLFARTDVQRRVFLNAIGPVWDGEPCSRRSRSSMRRCSRVSTWR